MRYFSQSLLIAVLLGSLAACSGDKKKKKKSVSHPLPQIESGLNLEKFTGARTKIVWAQYQNAEKADKQGTSRHHLLYAFDSADGRGARQVLEEKRNFAYPIISPDGDKIVFTQKEKITKGKNRSFKPVTFIVGFDGSGLRELGKGYAQEIWRDPKTGRDWIYAGEDFIMSGGTAPVCKRIIRYPIDDPGKRETVWNKTKMGTDSFSISADGKRFAGLFPWPAAGVGDLEKNDWQKLSNGCWTAMAPDNSYRSWVFDGPHRNLFMFDSNGNRTATVPVNTHPELKGQEVYHPRWGNHPGFVVLSGPHSSGKKGKRPGKKIEIYLGRFSPEFDHIDGWFKVSSNGLADIYPDVWIEGGNRIAKGTGSGGGPNTVKPSPAAKWPSDPAGLVLKWERIKAKNEYTAPDGSNQVTTLEPRGKARFGPNYEMVLDGGSFEPVLEGGAQLEKASASGTFALQGLVTPRADGTILEFGPDLLGMKQGKLYYSRAAESFEDFATVEENTPIHFAINVEGGKIGKIFINGMEAKGSRGDGFPGSEEKKKLKFGDGDFAGSLEHVAFYNRPITAVEAQTDFALLVTKLTKREPIERLQVKGKLVAMSDLPTLEGIDPYVRALVYYAYETDHPKFKEIAVGHWAILDSEPVDGLPRELGKTYDLTIEPKSAHRQLTSQAENIDEEKIGFQLPMFYDVTTP